MATTRGTPTPAKSNQPVDGLRVWVPVLVMMTCSWLSYIDRQAFSVLSPTILHDTGLSATGYANAVFGFSIAYMIGNLAWGSWLDFVGLRIGMLIAVGLWTLGSAAHSLVSGMWGFTMAQAVLGFGEGATFPGGLRTAADSLPPDKQSRGMGISYSGASVGAIVAPLIVTPVAIRFGWRAAFVVTGMVGVVWLTLWWIVARAPLLPPAPRKSGKIAWPNMSERRFWLLVINFGLGGAGLGQTIYLSPLYLNRVMGLSQHDLGNVLWISALIWELGYYFWGWIADRFVRENPRPVRLYILLTLLALVPSIMTKIHAWQVVLALFSWSMFVAVGFIVMSLHLGARAYSRDQTGMVAGIGSAAYSAVVAILIKIYGPLFDRHLYSWIFVSLSVVPALGTMLWWWIGRAPVRAPGDSRR